MLDEKRDEREASLPESGPLHAALEARRAILEQAAAAWPQLGTELLEVNCGAGFLQEGLRMQGFDVTGCEPSDFLRRRFAEVNGSHFTVEAGHSDLLPFENESFDWGILHLNENLSPEQLTASLYEMLRVVSLGFIVTFWNRKSPAGRLFAARDPDFPLYPAWNLVRRLAGRGMGTFWARTALAGPVSTWPEPGTQTGTPGGKIRAFINRPCCLPVGFCCVFRLELGPSRPLTMRPLRVKRHGFARRSLARCGEGSSI